MILDFIPNGPSEPSGHHPPGGRRPGRRPTAHAAPRALVVGLLIVQPARADGYLVVGAPALPADGERLLLQVLA